MGSQYNWVIYILKQVAWVEIPALPFTSYTILDLSLNLYFLIF